MKLPLLRKLCTPEANPWAKIGQLPANEGAVGTVIILFAAIVVCPLATVITKTIHPSSAAGVS